MLPDEFDADVDAGEVFFLYGGLSMTWPRAHLGLQLQGGLFGLRRVTIDYEIDAAKLDGDHWGLYGTYRFGQ